MILTHCCEEVINCYYVINCIGENLYLALPCYFEHIHILLSNLGPGSARQDPGSIDDLWTQVLDLLSCVPHHINTLVISTHRAGKVGNLYQLAGMLIKNHTVLLNISLPTILDSLYTCNERSS